MLQRDSEVTTPQSYYVAWNDRLPGIFAPSILLGSAVC